MPTQLIVQESNYIQNALYSPYSTVEIQNIPGQDPRTPAPALSEGVGKREGEGKAGPEGGEGSGRKGRGGRAGKGRGGRCAPQSRSYTYTAPRINVLPDFMHQQNQICCQFSTCKPYIVGLQVPAKDMLSMKFLR